MDNRYFTSFPNRISDGGQGPGATGQRPPAPGRAGQGQGGLRKGPHGAPHAGQQGMMSSSVKVCLA